jgi:hypothetical protein
VSRWRGALLAVITFAALVWTAFTAPSFVDGVSADCAEAASVPDPCEYGQFMFVAVTGALWFGGLLILTVAGLLVWRRGR